MLDRLPVGGEGDAQAIHGWLTAPSNDWMVTANADVKQ